MKEVPTKASWQNLASWISGRPLLAKSCIYVPNYEFSFFLFPLSALNRRISQVRRIKNEGKES